MAGAANAGFAVLCLASTLWVSFPLYALAPAIAGLSFMVGGAYVGVPPLIVCLGVVLLGLSPNISAAFLLSSILSSGAGWYVFRRHFSNGTLADTPGCFAIVTVAAAAPFLIGLVVLSESNANPTWTGAAFVSVVGVIAVDLGLYPLLQRLKGSQFPDDILSAGAEAICVLGPQGHVIYSNQAALSLLGVSDKEFREVSVFDRSVRGRDLSGKPFTRKNSPIRRVLETRVAERNIPIRYTSPDGRDLVLSLSLAPMAGLNRHIVCAIRDVTREWQQAQTITEQKDRLDLVIEGARIGIWSADLESGLTTINTEWAKLLGYTVAELTPVTLETWDSLVHPDDLPIVNALEQDVLDGRINRYNCEIRMRHKKGHWVWIRMVGRAADHHNDQGKPDRLFGVHIDISDLKRANAELTTVSVQLDSIIKAAPDGIVSVSSDGIILSFNPAAEKLFQWSADEIIGHRIEALVPDKHREAHTQNVAAFTRRDGSEPYGMADWRTVQGRRKDGSTFPVMVTLSRTTDTEGTRIVAILRDMTVVETQRQNVEKLTDELIIRIQEVEQANASKTRFLAMVSHELRTPLNAIIGFSDVLKSGMARGKSEEAIFEYYDAIHRSGQLLHSLIDDLLDLSKIEAGKFTLKLEAVEVQPVVKDVAETVDITAKARRISVSHYVSPDVGSVVADNRAIKQILLNLMSNAVKFSPDGDGQVHIDVGDAGPGFVRFSITDNGPGIPADVIPTLAKPFSRAEDPMTASAPGTGLGLAISKRLSERMQGSLRIESEVGVGTTVHVMLPVPTAEGPRAAVTTEAV
ncbi:PAS domain-containing sensor histidine kinase [Rhodospirillaceae bacterium KN72]|uniref:histidine kinase n=1 Tax=Pacificispira spongiicola TaxID=2729598 RepID=A0A7Y0HGB1_9PROT|nr:PAS domain-containing sensor histidine kinase [Pacificispira spongiicola]NMM45488.1 PAS domain-containing sensor histidine kinase [Pacificispira spongiicola]